MKESLDLKAVPCPQNISKIIIALELLDAGDVLEVELDQGEPFENVLLSIEEEGHQIIKTENLSSTTCKIIIKKT